MNATSVEASPATRRLAFTSAPLVCTCWAGRGRRPRRLGRGLRGVQSDLPTREHCLAAVAASDCMAALVSKIVPRFSFCMRVVRSLMSSGRSSTRSRNGGNSTGNTFSQKYRSLRNRPSAIPSSRSALVAAMMRTSAVRLLLLPTRSNVRS